MHVWRDVGPFADVNPSLSEIGRVEASDCGVEEVKTLGQWLVKGCDSWLSRGCASHGAIRSD